MLNLFNLTPTFVVEKGNIPKLYIEDEHLETYLTSSITEIVSAERARRVAESQSTTLQL